MTTYPHHERELHGGLIEVLLFPSIGSHGSLPGMCHPVCQTLITVTVRVTIHGGAGGNKGLLHLHLHLDPLDTYDPEKRVVQNLLRGRAGLGLPAEHRLE